MSHAHDLERIREAYSTARTALMAGLSADGCWRGDLSPSALAVATATAALTLVGGGSHASQVGLGLRWLCDHQNADGGWGDTPDSPSNLSTSWLCRAAFSIAAAEAPFAKTVHSVEGYLCREAGSEPGQRAAAVNAVYGADKTFAAPILMMCALAGLAPWSAVPRLPYELALTPRPLLGLARLGVVSYAMPALIAIGQLIEARKPSPAWVARLARRVALAPSLRILSRIQPASGGFLEAIPLTAFVAMSLAAAGRAGHPVARRCEAFLLRSARSDGSWPIEVNLCVWLTTMSVEALSHEGWRSAGVERWLLAQQASRRHDYTGAAPGGWGWNDLPGSVPDADDTAGALLALRCLGADTTAPSRAGGRWLLDLQNPDGGWPTFCRGWGRLPFDRSAPDLTAHALRALHSWRHVLPARRTGRALDLGLAHLRRSQRPDGSWTPLWFGNQGADGKRNPVYGTARVLAAFRDLDLDGDEAAAGGLRFLLAAQNDDGGWGGAAEVASSIEESALALDALAGWPYNGGVVRCCERGAAYLARSLAQGGLSRPAPVGLYFERLWYWEKMYPVIWSVAALGRFLAARGALQQGASPAL